MKLGYGDKVPRTKLGKMVGMIWTMFGICLVSVFTASVTTIMAEVLAGSEEIQKSIQSSNIGVIAGSIERHLVLQEAGKPIGKSFD